jgi:hypothetical protein
MKSIQIGKTHIVMDHITHFNFFPAQGAKIVDESKPALTGFRGNIREVPAQLAIYIHGEHVLSFNDHDADVEEAYEKLKEMFK